MKIIGKQPSREKCAESGWFAWDYLLDEPVEREFILKLRPLGGFTYLDMLKQPFFKIDSDYYMIKGIQGNDYSALLSMEARRSAGRVRTNYHRLHGKIISAIIL